MERALRPGPTPPRFAPLERDTRASLRRLGVPPGAGVLVGASAGADSTALATLLARAAAPLRLRIVLAHIAHRLRPAQDPRDREHVRALARAVGARFAAASLPRPPRGEAAAREGRHALLARLAARRGCAWIALGHTADDQAETVLWNLVRGAGLRGLGGMPARRRVRGTSARAPVLRIVRPLLEARRADLRAYLRARGIPWREDRTNASLRYTRNRIRRSILPLLEALRPGAAARIARAAREARAARLPISRAARQALPLPTAATLPASSLRGHPAAVRREILRLWIRVRGGRSSLVHLDSLDALATRGRPGEAVSYPGAGITLRDRDALRTNAPTSRHRTTRARG